MSRQLILALALLLAAPSLSRGADEPVDLSMMTTIRDEGFRRSQVMDTLFHLTDVIGPRLTGSPQLKEANEWTRRQFESWGLANAHLEGYPFGRGWSFSACEVRMVSPRQIPIAALPRAWTPGTKGPVKGEALRATLESEKDFEGYRGKLAGKILLIDDAYDAVKDAEEPEPERYSREQLEGLGDFEMPGEERDWRQMGIKRYRFRKALDEFLVKEKAAAVISVSSRPNGILRVSAGGSWEPGESASVPSLVMASEPYNQILRLLEAGKPVELEIDVKARFDDGDLKAYNTVAEIPGTDKADELVMAGAHLDSWHGGTGATDNAAGSAVVMEAARILKALGVKPRRTLRFVLWSGEEQGYLGSIAYAKEHFATRPEPQDPEQKKLPERFRDDTWPLTLKPEHAKLSAYFNLDTGSGKIRGIWTEGSAGVKPIFEAWLAPFADLGATAVSMNGTNGTDHVVFDELGLPGFEFIQDRLDYESRTHHTNLDTYDHLKRADLMQASVIMAAFLYDAAMRPEPLPRKPLPQERPKKKEAKPEKKETGTR
ncbi:MAG TPA: M20/M25/M40 family metallo-hydrolase [Thermoanaerobaculia bacterium]|nr:M20/M25/M40 family metallo-hydrolase [Thermoanaerobaculia bacterium]